jgi:flagellar biosynthetic protein FliR
MTAPFELISLSASYVECFALALVRVAGALSMNPVLGSSRVPPIGRIGLAIFITMVIFPPGAPQSPAVSFGVPALIGELLLGLLVGFVLALVFASVQYAASLVGVSSGFNLAGSLNPSAELGQGPLEQFFSILAIVVFLLSNGHHLFLIGIHELFQSVPVGTVTLVPQTGEGLVLVTTSIMSAAIKMVFPIVAALLLADLGLAILARAAPQLNLFAIGLPAKLLIALAALVITMPWLLPRLAAMFRGVPSAMMVVGG